MKPLKTLENIKRVRLILASQFPQQTIRIKDVLPHLVKNGLHEMNFYYLLYSGCLEKQDRGVFFKTIKYNSMSDSEVYNKAQSVLNRMRDRKKFDLVNVYKKNKVNDLTLDDCISFLKVKGYKIMKPINQYEEV